MNDIYKKQLTSRGGSTGNLTARGSNHFLSTNTKSNFPSLKSSRQSSSTSRSRSTTSNSNVSNTSNKIQRFSYQTHSKGLPHLSCDSGRTPITPPHHNKQYSARSNVTTRTRDRRLNAKIIKSIKKKKQFNTRFLAPVKPTEEELQMKRTQLENLRAALREKLYEVDTELIAEVTELTKQQSMMAQFNALTKQLDRIELQGNQQEMSNNEVEKNSDSRIETVSLENEQLLLDKSIALNDPDIQAALKDVNDELKITTVNSATFENVIGCSLGDSYAPDVLKRNSDMYNGQQEIGSGPHSQFTAPKNLRATVIGGRYYPPGQVPESSKGDDGLFWPFEENRTKNSPPKPIARKVAPRAAHVSAKVQGGFAPILIDVNAPLGKKHQQPTRWQEIDSTNDILQFSKDSRKASMERAGVVPGTTRGEKYSAWHPTVGGKCNARFKLDKEWYLATILKIDSKGLTVKFESRGNKQICVVQPKNVKPVVWNRPLTAQWSR